MTVNAFLAGNQNEGKSFYTERIPALRKAGLGLAGPTDRRRDLKTKVTRSRIRTSAGPSARFSCNANAGAGDRHKNEESPPGLAAKRGQIGGWEFAKLSFPCRHLALTLRRLPASRRHSPRQTESPASWQGRPTSCKVEFRVRLFSSLRLVAMPPACEPGQDTSAISRSRLDHWTLVGHRF